MSIKKNDNIHTRAPKVLDNRMKRPNGTTYADKQDVIDILPSFERSVGLIVMIGTDLHFFKLGTYQASDIFKILSEADIVQTTGNGTGVIMSQDAVTQNLYSHWQLLIEGNKVKDVEKEDEVNFKGQGGIIVSFDPSTDTVIIEGNVDADDFMTKDVYDPNGVEGDVFDWNNMHSKPVYREDMITGAEGTLVGDILTFNTTFPVLLTEIHFVTINGVVVPNAAIIYNFSEIKVDYDYLDFPPQTEDRIEVRYYHLPSF